MIVETIVIKNKVTGLEIVAHYSDSYNYRLSTGESCYSVIIEYNGIEYVICISKDYQIIYKMAERLTEDIGFPLAVNRVTKLRGNDYNIVRDSICIDAFNRTLDRQRSHTDIFERYMISDADNQLCEDMMNFDLTTRNWNSQSGEDPK